MKALKTRIVMFVAAVFMSLTVIAVSYSTPPAGTDYTIHTLYIFSFTKYIEWPAGQSKIRIGVVGNASAEEMFEKMAKARSTSVSGISVVNSTDDSELGTCQVIFIPANSSSMAAGLIERFGNRPILIVTEESNMVKKGAAISFKVNDNKLRFQINEEPIEARGMKVSGALISLAEKQ